MYKHIFLHRNLFEANFDWSKALFKQQNPCSNHEIHVPFENAFWPMSLVNATLHHVFRRNKMADVEEAPRFL